jgi:hypothetical protein
VVSGYEHIVSAVGKGYSGDGTPMIRSMSARTEATQARVCGSLEKSHRIRASDALQCVQIHESITRARN